MGLLAMVVGFYVVILLSLGLVLAGAAAFVGGMIWLVSKLRFFFLASKLILLLLPVLGAFGVMALALLRSLLIRVGGEPTGIRCSRMTHDAIYQLTDAVALDLDATPIERIYLTPGLEMGVCEEAALWMPPGFGRRTLVVGMAMLDRLTIDQFRSILAHEYGHFSARDTYFSRFISRVYAGFGALVMAMAGQPLRHINPVYGMLWGYFLLYAWAAAAHSRIREFHADRCEVELSGKKLFEESLIVGHVEGSYFGGVWARKLLSFAHTRNFPGNIYREVSVGRLEIHAREGTDGLLGVLADMYEEKASRYDSHPGVLRRLQAQGVDAGNCDIPAPTRVAPSKEDARLDAVRLNVLRNGPPSAAEQLLGADLEKVQRQLSALLSEEIRDQIAFARMRANLG